MSDVVMDQNVLAGILAAVMALALDYFPGVAAWFDEQAAARKKQIVAGLLLVISLVLAADGCWLGVFNMVQCSTGGLLDFAKVFIGLLLSGVVGSQSTHMLAKKSG